jgi:hypothetical protein
MLWQFEFEFEFSELVRQGFLRRFIHNF